MTVIREATFVLNPDDASTYTRQTWVTVQLRDDRSLWRLSNMGGNGQTWECFGYVTKGETQLFTTNATEAQQARILGHVAYRAERECNVKGFGVAWSKATWACPTVSTQTGRKLTAAPSIRLGRVDRDKNVDQMRLRVGGGFMARDGGTNPLLDNETRKRATSYVARITCTGGVEVNADTMRRLA